MPAEGFGQLKGKSALVTGSTSGIGFSIAAGLAKAGASVMLNGLGDSGAIERLRSSLAADTGAAVRFSPADMTKPGEIAQLVQETEAAFGAIDILVNCAGIQFVSPVEEFPDQAWERIISINLSSSFYTIKAALPAMARQGWGRIINIASAHGLVASPFKSAYVSAKHGLVGLTKTVALETAESGITCNAICPGYVRTPLVEGQIADQAMAHRMSEDEVIRKVILAAQPNKRFVDPDEISDLTLFLCSPGGTSITGAALAMDGAWTSR